MVADAVWPELPAHPELAFRAVLDALTMPVFVRDLEHRIIWANPAGLRVIGVDSVETLQTLSPDEIMADYEVTDEAGEPVAMADIPSVRLMAGEPADPLIMRIVHRTSGGEHWQRLNARPLHDATGAIVATVQTVEDLTERIRAQRAAAYLSDASAALAESLDPEATLTRLAELAVPTLADWCAIDLVDEHGHRRSVAVAHRDPERRAIGTELRSYRPSTIDPASSFGRVIYGREVLRIADITPEMLAAGAQDERHLELLRALGLRSILTLPLATPLRVLGAITLVNSSASRAFDDADERVGRALAARAAQAVENALLYQERAAAAGTLEASLKPEPLPHVAGLELAAFYHPGGEGSEVGGDILDVWAAGGVCWALVGDVTGRGIEAASLTGRLRHTVRGASAYVTGPGELLARADAALGGLDRLALASALCLRIDDASLTVACAGHPAPLRAGPDGVAELAVQGRLLGLEGEGAWSELSLELGEGETLLLYTDGVTDARGRDGRRLGEAPLIEALERTRRTRETWSAAAVAELIEASLLAAVGGRLGDDAAALVLRRVAV